MRSKALVAGFAVAATAMFFVYCYFFPKPYNYQNKIETAYRNSIDSIFNDYELSSKIPKEIRDKYASHPEQLLIDSPSCCEAWVFYGPLAPNDRLKERSVRNALEKIPTFLNLETYLVRIRWDAHHMDKWGETVVSGQGGVIEKTIAEYKKK